MKGREIRVSEVRKHVGPEWRSKEKIQDRVLGRRGGVDISVSPLSYLVYKFRDGGRENEVISKHLKYLRDEGYIKSRFKVLFVHFDGSKASPRYSAPWGSLEFRKLDDTYIYIDEKLESSMVA
jgi:DNA-binding transcriptional ArsR family regulator